MKQPPPAAELDDYYLSVVPPVLPGYLIAGLSPGWAERYRAAVALIADNQHRTAALELGRLAGDCAGTDHGLCQATAAMAWAVVGDHRAAACSLSAAQTLAPDCPEYWYLDGMLALRRRELTQATAGFRRATGLRPRFGPAWAALALTSALAGDWAATAEPARRALALGAELGPRLVEYCLMFATLFQGRPVVTPFPIPVAAASGPDPIDRLLVRLPAVACPVAPPGPGAEPIVYSFCDTVYLAEHATALVLSLEQVASAPAIGFHLHVANPSSDDPARLSTLAERLRRVSLTWSFETVDLTRFGPPAVYYSCVRFCRFYQLLRLTGRPALMVDADMLFRQCPRRLPGWADPTLEIGLIGQPHAPPWERFLAEATFCAPTAAGLRFLEPAVAMIAEALLAGTGRWFLDQIALFLAHRERAASTRLIEWHRDLVADLSHGENAILWAVTLRKHVEGPFTDYKRALLQDFSAVATP